MQKIQSKKPHREIKINLFLPFFGDLGSFWGLIMHKLCKMIFYRPPMQLKYLSIHDDLPVTWGNFGLWGNFGHISVFWIPDLS